jgi:hypothetical protein
MFGFHKKGVEVFSPIREGGFPFNKHQNSDADATLKRWFPFKTRHFSVAEALRKRQSLFLSTSAVQFGNAATGIKKGLTFKASPVSFSAYARLWNTF